MKRICLSLITAAVFFQAHAASALPELWNFQFAPDGTLPVAISGDVSNARADVEGSFTLLLDWERLVGRLVSLNDQLVNIFDVLPNQQMEPSLQNWGTHGIVTPLVTETYLEGPFIFENNMWKVSSNGQPAGGSGPTGLPYTVTFTLTQASLDLTVPGDASVQVTDAPATFTNATIAGDFNGDFVLDAADYVLWRKLGGSSTGYDYWTQGFGHGGGGGGNSTVPEPATLVSVLSAALLLGALRRSRN